MARRVAFLALFSALAVHVLLGFVAVAAPLEHAVHLAVQLGSFALVAARVIVSRRNRAAWGLIALGLALWALGNLVGPGVYLGTFLAGYVALALLLKDRVRPFPAW